MRNYLAGTAAFVVAVGLYKAFAAPGGNYVAMPSGPGSDQLGPDEVMREAAEDRDAVAFKACVGKEPTVACGVLRGKMIAHFIRYFDMLDDLAASEATDEAVSALDIDDPLLQHSALEYLGRVAPNNAVAPAVTVRVRQLLAASRTPAVGDMAAKVLERRDPASRSIVRRWRDHHQAFIGDELDVAYWRTLEMPDLGKLGFATYPGATADAAADSDRSVGLFTTDPVDKVIAFYAKQPHAEVIAPDKLGPWVGGRVAQDSGAAGVASANVPSAADVQEMQRLAEQYQKTHDPKLIAKIQAMSQKMTPAAATQALPSGPRPQGATTEPYAYHMEDKDTANAIVLATDHDHVTRMVFVYPEPTLGGTAIELAWSLVETPPVGGDPMGP